jgi:hypothetical protein
MSGLYSVTVLEGAIDTLAARLSGREWWVQREEHLTSHTARVLLLEIWGDTAVSELCYSLARTIHITTSAISLTI